MPSPIDLTKPGRCYVLDACDTHRVYAHRWGGLEIERIADGATAFFQGDDAERLGAQVWACVRRPAYVLQSVLDGYDAVLTLPEE